MTSAPSCAAPAALKAASVASPLKSSRFSAAAAALSMSRKQSLSSSSDSAASADWGGGGGGGQARGQRRLLVGATPGLASPAPPAPR
jgi:hypothetical protein